MKTLGIVTAMVLAAGLIAVLSMAGAGTKKGRRLSSGVFAAVKEQN